MFVPVTIFDVCSIAACIMHKHMAPQWARTFIQIACCRHRQVLKHIGKLL